MTFTMTLYGQSFNDLFTTYQNANTQQNSGVAQYQTIDPDQFYQSIAPQNVQMVNGVFLYQGQFYSVKLKVGISRTNPNQIVVCGFWDGQCWHNSTSYASKFAHTEYLNKSEWLAHIKSIFHLSALYSFNTKLITV